MKHNKLFLTLAFLAADFSNLKAASTPVSRFLAPPVVEHFPDGAVEWRGSVSCLDPVAISGVRIVFSFDYNLDGMAEGTTDSLWLSPAYCDSGEVGMVRTFFPSATGILTAELRQGNTLLDHHSAFMGEIGSLLSIRRFCARPSDGEPEWIEVGNVSPRQLNLANVRVEGRLLSGAMEPGAKVLVGRDSMELLRWQPNAGILTTTAWTSLRNTGDTLRLTWNTTAVLDSVIYGSAVDPREGCASALSEENVAAASGYEMEVSSVLWNSRTEPLRVKVQAPRDGSWNLSAYDLDGFEICSMANKRGSTEVQISEWDCQGLVNRSGSVLLQLRPAATVPIRKRIRIVNR